MAQRKVTNSTPDLQQLVRFPILAVPQTFEPLSVLSFRLCAVKEDCDGKVKLFIFVW